MNKSPFGSWWKNASWLYVLLILAIAGLQLVPAVVNNRDLMRQPSKPLVYVPRSAYYKSLNLSLAKQAVYTSQPVQQITDLGINKKVRTYTIRFEVPKDGLSEYGLMSLPITPAPKHGYPVLILCHGYVNPHYYSTTKDYLPDMEFYSQHGFAVLKPDFRGQGLSAGAGTADGAFYSMSYNTDVMSLIAAVQQTSYLNRSNINLWVHSMGGYIALRVAVVSADIKHVILLSAPVGTVKDRFTQYRALSDLDNPTAIRVRNEQLALHGNPLSNPRYWDATSPLNYLGASKATFEINVAANDSIIPQHFANDLITGLSKEGKKYQYFVYPKASHGLVPQRPLIWKRSLRLLENK